MIPQSMHPRRIDRFVRGFSLVEVTLSVSIMTFAALSLVGLLPSNIAKLSNNIEKNRAQGISQTVLLEADRMPFVDLLQTGTFVRYFDAQGELQTVANNSVVYAARVRVNRDQGGNQKQIRIPGGVTPPASMATVSVDIFRAPGGVYKSDVAALATYSGFVTCKDLSVLQQ